MIRSAEATDTGCVREHNEDAVVSIPSVGFWAVADGMGGHEAGEVASRIVCECLPQLISDGAALPEAINICHHQIRAAAANGQGVPGMGSTVVACRILEAHYDIAWVGDSRGYLWNEALRQLTRDHSIVQRLKDAGALSEAEARTHPKRNLITQSLGAMNLENVEVGHVQGALKDENIILLCSDGLTEELTDREIEQILSKTDQDLQQRAEGMINAAKISGGSDNISVIVIQYCHVHNRFKAFQRWLQKLFAPSTRSASNDK